MLSNDWVGLARELEISDSDINIIKSQYPNNAPQQAIVMLRLWMQTSSNKATGNTLEKGLRKINRDDIVNQCIFNVELVTDDMEKAMAKAHLDQSGFDALKSELGPSKDTTLNRDMSLDVSYDEKDMMKEAESAEEDDDNQKFYQDKAGRIQQPPTAADLSPTYEREEKKYAGEEKAVPEEKLSKEEMEKMNKFEKHFKESKVEEIIEHKEFVINKAGEKLSDVKIIEEVKHEMSKEPSKVDFIGKGIDDMKDEPKIKQESLEKDKEEKMSGQYDVKTETSTTILPGGEKTVTKVTTKTTEDGVEKTTLISTFREEPGVETVVTRVVDGVSKTDLPEPSVVTDKRRSFTTDEDGTVTEHIITETRTTSVVDSSDFKSDKAELLQKLGEELGKLDEQLEEKFKERRKAEEPEEGFTQTSVEQTQTIVAVDASPSAAQMDATEVTPTDAAPATAAFHASPGTHDANTAATQETSEQPAGVNSELPQAAVEGKGETPAQTQKKTPGVGETLPLKSTSDKEDKCASVASLKLDAKQSLSKEQLAKGKNKKQFAENKSKINSQSLEDNLNDFKVGELTKRVTDVATSMASTLEKITAITEGLEVSHGSSDEGEEQLMLMRDSPCWEEEEIQAEDTDEPKAIKAEIKLLVKTTELGKESIEIRSIREFVDPKGKEENKTETKATSPANARKLSSPKDGVYTLQRQTSPGRTPSPRFVRSPEKAKICDVGKDEFDLMAQVRDILSEAAPVIRDGTRPSPLAGSSEGQRKKKDKKKT